MYSLSPFLFNIDIRESAKKSNKNDPLLQGFELRGKVEKVWSNNTGENVE